MEREQNAIDPDGSAEVWQQAEQCPPSISALGWARFC
jgi:hypothetical protein